MTIGVSLCWLAVSAWGNLVFNGNFSGGTSPQNFGGTIDILPNGWTLNPPNTASTTNLNVVPALSGFTDPLNDSPQYMAFASSSTAGQDCLFNSIMTTPGQQYQVSFWLAISSPGASSSPLYMSFEWDVGGANDQTLLPTGFSSAVFVSTVNPGPQAFQEFTYNLIASNTTTGFYFHGTDSSGAILLADVSMAQQSPLPEPASFWLIGLGLAVVGWLRYAPSRSR
jgi:hypothetical protein